MLVAVVVLTIMIRFPLTEGRATNLDLFSIYADPFILYGYATSVPFFIALYKAFKLFREIGRNKAISLSSLSALTGIKYCAVILSILISAAGIYIKIFHSKDDDPAGFLAMCIVITFVSIVVAIAASVFEKILKDRMGIKSKNEALYRPLKK